MAYQWNDSVFSHFIDNAMLNNQNKHFIFVKHYKYLSVILRLQANHVQGNIFFFICAVDRQSEPCMPKWLLTATIDYSIKSVIMSFTLLVCC